MDMFLGRLHFLSLASRGCQFLFSEHQLVPGIGATRFQQHDSVESEDIVFGSGAILQPKSRARVTLQGYQTAFLSR